jgi:hypothetical protein
MSFGSVFLFRDRPAYLGYDTLRVLWGWEALAAASVAVLSMGALVYVACVCWLVFATLYFTRAQVSKIVFHGPTTRFDRWLVNKLFPERQ